MNVKQLHNLVKQQLQRIDANATTYFQPPEIDLAINQEVWKFIKQHYVPQGNRYLEGFEESSKRIEDLRKLVVPDYADDVVISDFDDSVVKFPLPSDHFLLSRARARVFTQGCNKVISTGKQSRAFTYVLIPTDFINEIEGKMVSFSLKADGNNITTTQYNNNVATTFYFPEDSRDFIRSLEEDNTTNPGYSIHYEVYKNISKENTLIVEVPDTVNQVEVSINDGTEFPARTYDSINTSIYEVYTYEGPDEELKTDYNRARFSQSHDIDKLLKDPHNTTRPQAPLFTVRDNYIDVYQDEDFYVDKFAIDYVRMPKRVSYERNQDLELPEHTHDEIAKAAASYLAAMAADQRYEYLESESRRSE